LKNGEVKWTSLPVQSKCSAQTLATWIQTPGPGVPLGLRAGPNRASAVAAHRELVVGFSHHASTRAARQPAKGRRRPDTTPGSPARREPRAHGPRTLLRADHTGCFPSARLPRPKGERKRRSCSDFRLSELSCVVRAWNGTVSVCRPSVDRRHGSSKRTPHAACVCRSWTRVLASTPYTSALYVIYVSAGRRLRLASHTIR
jgi:hypothetical protein